MKIIGFATPAAKEKLGAAITAANLWLQKQPDDWFYPYEINGQKYFIEQNETGSYTILLPEEH